MRLLTRCPACSTTFKVVRDQLRISDGWVRCGRCSEVFDATQSLWEANEDGTPSAPLAATQPPAAFVAPEPPQGAAPSVPPSAKPVAPFDEGAKDDLEGEDPFDLGPDPPLPSAGFAATPMSWPSADLLELGELGRSSAFAAPPPAAPAPSTVSSIAFTGALAHPVTGGSGAVLHEPHFDALPSLDIGLSEASALRREPAFSPQLTTPSPISPIEEAVNAQLKKALRRERVKALRQERAEKRERERADARGDMPVDGDRPAGAPTGAQSAPFAVAPSPDAALTGRHSPSMDVPDAATAPYPLDQSATATPSSSGQAGAGDPALNTGPALPSFAGGDELRAPPRRMANWLWAMACLVAIAGLVLQYVRHERDLLAAREPALRPALQQLCDWTGCTLQPPRSIADISIEGAAFSRETDGYRLDFSLRNRARVSLAMPAVELTLLDTQERALLRRVLLPSEYGAPGVLAAGAERSASLPLRLAGPEAAGLTSVAGYRLVAFYP